MIQINLLPPEYRVKERAPVSRLLGLGAAVTAVMLSLVLFGWARWAWKAGEIQRHEDKTSDEANYRKRAKQHDDLMAEKKKFKERNDRIEEIKTKDPLYARTLAEVASVVWYGEESRKFTAWFETLSVSEGRQKTGSKSKAAPELAFDASVASDDSGKSSEFYKALKENERLQQDLDHASWKDISYTVEEQKGFSPNKTMETKPTVSLRTPEDKAKRAADAKKAGAGAPAKPAAGAPGAPGAGAPGAGAPPAGGAPAGGAAPPPAKPGDGKAGEPK